MSTLTQTCTPPRTRHSWYMQRCAHCGAARGVAQFTKPLAQVPRACTDPYIHGYDAARDDEPWRANPYMVGDERHALWRLGWEEGMAV